MGFWCATPTGPGAIPAAVAGGGAGGIIGTLCAPVVGAVCYLEEVCNGQERCEEDALRKADAALKDCRRIYEICCLKNPIGKGRE